VVACAVRYGPPPRGSARARWRRRAILATLTFAGLRVGEPVELRWREVGLAAGRLTVRASKTDAGVRVIHLLPALRDELATFKANATPGSSERVFPTRAGGPLNQSSVRNRTLALSVERANEHLEKAGEPRGRRVHASRLPARDALR
jgi:integrase